MNFVRKVYDWMGEKVHAKYSLFWLLLLTFLESFIFPIPTDPMLILYCIEKPKKSIYFAALSTLVSVAGGLFGYFIGAFMWNIVGQYIINYIISPAAFEAARAKYVAYQMWAVLIAGFTPVPYKAVTLSAGFCHLPVTPFIIFSIIGRGGRFFLVAGAIQIWGAQIKNFIDKHFNKLAVLFVFLVLFFIWLIK
ncbi:TPA: cytochrome B [Candidatus Dependentiae bacterium]|nr:MAG: hypothetical protein UR14_C0008G0041 [candidate division TM6 bacterium GW2011_GWE2_31_21]KKP53233.1 MAG: hypothetical protein UR43_C0006G0016 [candidate division TM6 bacterium GW2011_GWF2_33_332]HBS48068.1 cytochrome B [Candidatus Dependentiae bacterium]HBZ73329.1 cytochrome B [Candidatus Dependentiae bacterium]